VLYTKSGFRLREPLFLMQGQQLKGGNRTSSDNVHLVRNASAILGPGFFVPARNHEVIYWLLENGFQIGWPANLMTIGHYQEPVTPFLPSLAY
jgi:hypothetical protein